MSQPNVRRPNSDRAARVRFTLYLCFFCPIFGLHELLFVRFGLLYNSILICQNLPDTALELEHS